MIVRSVPKYVFDTSAIMALLNGEPEGPGVESIVAQADAGEADVALPFVVLMEVEYLLLRARPAAEARSYVERLSSWPATILESTEEWRHRAAQVKAAGDISMADAWVASFALLTDATVLHKDRQFVKIPGLKQRDLRLGGPPLDR